MLETVRTQSRQIQGVLGAIGAVAMLVAAICVANTMMMSITERTREIGVLKVLGTTLGNISGLFLIEALLVGVFGGLMGLGLSFLMQKAIPFLFRGIRRGLLRRDGAARGVHPGQKRHACQPERSNSGTVKSTTPLNDCDDQFMLGAALGRTCK